VPAHPAQDWLARSRGAAGPTPPTLLGRATDRAAPLAGDPAEIAYAAMLDQALADGYLSLDESGQLHELARSVGLAEADRRDVQLRYFEALADAAWGDGVLSLAVRTQVQAVGIMLDIPSRAVEAALRKRVVDAGVARVAGPRSRRVDPSDVVVLTGEMSESREVLEVLVSSTGAQVGRGVTKKTTLLAAADPDSLSGKAQKARQYGVEIVDEAALRRLLSPAS
jgi:DNA polymerase-3 subunit epsilon